jgi:RNA polymerase sigma-70 factor (ECF subfamily)
MTTDTLLVERAMRGDRAAFDAIFDASLPAVYAFAARRSGGRHSAERLTGRILERAFREIEHYGGDVPFAAWLLGIAREVLREQHRSRPPLRTATRPPVAYGS